MNTRKVVFAMVVVCLTIIGICIAQVNEANSKIQALQAQVTSLQSANSSYDQEVIDLNRSIEFNKKQVRHVVIDQVKQSFLQSYGRDPLFAHTYLVTDYQGLVAKEQLTISNDSQCAPLADGVFLCVGTPFRVNYQLQTFQAEVSAGMVVDMTMQGKFTIRAASDLYKPGQSTQSWELEKEIITN